MVQSHPFGPSSRYCERDHFDSIIRQPSNTWSNFAYMAYGFICLGMGIMDYRRTTPSPNFIVSAPAISLLYALTLTYLCWGSFLFHASLTRIGQHWDMAATYSVTILPSVILLIRIIAPKVKLHIQVMAVYGLAALVFFLLYRFKWQMDGQTFMISFILMLTGLTLIYKFKQGVYISLPFGLAALACMSLAFFIWMKDVSKEWCDPEGLIQGHSIWHLLTGLAALMTYLLLRTERAKTLKT